ncbi:hypothetical protein GQ55_3G131800 [Panicum hallii var. hallii]|uniref:Uncharacterized protein n=1 Tax=Panicum hallii var. hallii TaxID=1504633 RepID=A0A2T7E8X4_9POAL|nr:hypothetical protein GQ55_3G131800 [Panicum hallii var. hallii]
MLRLIRTMETELSIKTCLLLWVPWSAMNKANQRQSNSRNSDTVDYEQLKEPAGTTEWCRSRWQAPPSETLKVQR